MPTKRDCLRAERHLQALADGELYAGDHARLQAHLDECAACRHLGAFDEQVRKALREEPAVLHWRQLPTGRELLLAGALVPSPRGRSRLAPAVAAMAGALALAVLTLKTPAPHRASQARPSTAALPALVVVDDEAAGRQVLVAPPERTP